MNENEIIKEFQVAVYGNLEKFNDVISKGRCRIFYKGANRNGTFITDEFADKLLSTIPYAPVKGIFDEQEGDYTDHGTRRDMGRIYGVVPAEPHLAWEKHLDEDGVEREYACVDVLLYTAIYKEASTISGKSQSMELYGDSIKGDWQIINGVRYYVFTDACFLGLEVLGDNTEPCFEGAAFYTLYHSIVDMVKKLESDYNNFQKNGQGGKEMADTIFKISDNQKQQFLWDLLNTEVDENGCVNVKYGICDVYDEYAVVINYDDCTYERVYYKKDDETNSVEITERKKCYIIDVEEDEMNALKSVRAMNDNTYAHLDEKMAEVNSLNNQISEIGTKVEELSGQLSTLSQEREDALSSLATTNTELDNVKAQYSACQENVVALTAERDTLAAFKKTVEDDAKRTIINGYADSLSDEVIDGYMNNLDSYTAQDLDMKLTYEVKKAHPEMFNKTPVVAYVPKDEPQAGIEVILAKYERH